MSGVVHALQPLSVLAFTPGGGTWVSAQDLSIPFSAPCFPHLHGTHPCLASLLGAVTSELEVPVKKYKSLPLVRPQWVPSAQEGSSSPAPFLASPGTLAAGQHLRKCSVPAPRPGLSQDARAPKNHRIGPEQVQTVEEAQQAQPGAANLVGKAAGMELAHPAGRYLPATGRRWGTREHGGAGRPGDPDSLLCQQLLVP